MRLIISVVVTLGLFLTTTCVVLAEDSTSTANPKKDARLEEMRVKKEATKDRVETKRLEALANHGARLDAIKDKIASRAAALKQKLQTFKDQKKAQRVERINDNLNKINQNQTSQMDKHLDKMLEILTKVENRASTASANAATEIGSAKTAIANAKAAVASQSAKDYSLTIATESAAKTQAQAMRTKLHTDLKSVREIVIAAKQSVANAIRAVATNIGGSL